MATTELGAVLRHVRGLAAHRPTDERSDGELVRAFLTDHDQAAFEAVLRRHGPMVLNLCRRRLANLQDAEDAFQATFLLLARRPASIRKRESLAGWLHGVAYRMAAHAHRAAARRRKHEQQAGPPRPAAPVPSAEWQEIQAVLDEEIARLPEIYREPFVLCCLEHKSGAEVACRLGRTEAVVRNRLSRARKLLRERLARRGVSLTAVLAAAALSADSVLAAVPRTLLGSTVKAGSHLAAGQELTGALVPAAVIALVEGANRAMILTKVKVVLLLLVAAGLVGVGALRRLPAQPPAESPTRVQRVPGQPDQEKGPPNATDGLIVVGGRVLDPNEKPIAGARVVCTAVGAKEDGAPVTATTGDDGRFRLTVRPADPKQGTIRVVATARGHGPDWAIRDASKAAELTLKLARDDVPVSGRILDLQGRPVAGATVQAVQLGKPAAGDLATWVNQNIKWLASHSYASEGVLRFVPAGLAGTAAPLTTDKDGRFRLTGIGRDRAAIVDVRGPGIERRRIWVATLERPPKELAGVVGLYGPAFDHHAGPAKPATGTVTDSQTGKPLTGIRVLGWVRRMGYARGGEVEALTDARGGYRLEGLPKSDEYFITVEPPDGLTYLPQEKTLADTEGLKPLKADFALARGTLVEGRLLDQETGKPVRGSVCYHPLPGNDLFQPAVRGKLAVLIRRGQPVGDDGSFKLLVGPGPGVVCAWGDFESYLRAPVNKEDAAVGAGRQVVLEYQENLAIVTMNGHAYRVVRPGEKPESLSFDLKLLKGRRVTGSFQAGGKLGPGVEFCGHNAYDLPIRVAVDEKAGTFTASGLDPHRPNLMVFYHKNQKLAGGIDSSGKALEAPLVVRLEPWGTVRGRILDAGGKAVAGTMVHVAFRDGAGRAGGFQTGPLSGWKKCDGEGRFQVEGLVPGIEFEISVRVPDGPYRGQKPVLCQTIPGGPTKAGRVNDIGDVKLPPRGED